MKVTTLNNLINTLPRMLKHPTKFLAAQELSPSLEASRFVQDTAVNLAPKALFSRSKVDLAETSFLEISESLIVYYGPKVLGEKLFRKFYSKKIPQSLQQILSTPMRDLKGLSEKESNTLKPVKAAIALSCLVIPFAEFSLSYLKNLFTLKVFKQADFNNIANLNRTKFEDVKKQQIVEKNAKKNIKLAGLASIGAILTSLVLVKKGHSSKALLKLSDLVLTPGKFIKNKKVSNFINKYFSLDFSDKNGKLALSKGQLTSCVLLGGAGYFGAAKDRGKENFKETLFRFPLVGFYVITGSELFEKGFKKILRSSNSYKQIIAKDLSVPKFGELVNVAQNLAKQNASSVEGEFKKLCKQKLIISSVPFAFSIAVMGAFVMGVSNAFTRHRYEKDQVKKSKLCSFAAKSPFNL